MKDETRRVARSVFIDLSLGEVSGCWRCHARRELEVPALRFACRLEFRDTKDCGEDDYYSGNQTGGSCLVNLTRILNHNPCVVESKIRIRIRITRMTGMPPVWLPD